MRAPTRIRQLIPLSPLTNVRMDVFETPGGQKTKYCACNGRTKCLYHWYYEDMGGLPPERRPGARVRTESKPVEVLPPKPRRIEIQPLVQERPRISSKKRPRSR